MQQVLIHRQGSTGASATEALGSVPLEDRRADRHGERGWASTGHSASQQKGVGTGSSDKRRDLSEFTGERKRRLQEPHSRNLKASATQKHSHCAESSIPHAGQNTSHTVGGVAQMLRLFVFYPQNKMQSVF